jgi:choline dehydrogenase-like flavoprotein
MSGEKTFDYIIVGGGSAGCVLANRLSADGRHQVCLLEAGPADKSPLVHMPAGVIQLMRSATHNWQFWTTPQKHLDDRERYCPRGKTLGGSSSINAMVYIRGNAWDYDHWASLGNTGWSYREVLPYFRSTENFEAGADASGALAPDVAEFHGSGGGLNVSKGVSPNRLSQVFLTAMQQAGYQPTPDFNGTQQEGSGPYHVMQKGGKRCSNAQGFLREAESRPNLKIITEVRATRVLFEGKHAVGVRYYDHGRFVDIHARREVILSAGAIGSPQLLQLSGVGPRSEIERHGIPLVHELPGVGQNLQDHLDVVVSVREKTHLSMTFHPLALLRSLVELCKYVFAKKGQFTSNVAEVGGFIKTQASEPLPDLQLHFVPIPYSHHGLDLRSLFKYFAYTVLCCDLRPLSRGTVTLYTADPLASPRIDPNYGAQPRDLEKLVIGIKKVREILAQRAFDPHRRLELEPGPEVQTDAQLLDWVRANAETVYHPVGTCKMGNDPMAVVDPQLRVRGLSGLRVVDASIMPTLIGGNTNAPTTMISEKAAAMILQAQQGATLAQAA